MIAALFYLQYHSFRNRLRTRLARLKQPKYLAGAIVGGAYFYFYFFRYLFQGGGGRGARLTLTSESSLLYESIAALVLLLMVFMAWLIPNKRTALAFTEAEVAFLFPAPISRRGVIHFKLLRSQMAILFTTVLLTLFSNRLGGNVLFHAAGWWVFLSTFNLHSLASSFARTRLLDRGISNWQRRAAVLVLAGGAVGAVLWWAYRAIPGFDIARLRDVEAVKEYAQQAFASGPLPYLLFPFRLMVRPYLATSAASFFLALGPALLIMLAHYWWVVRANVAFEEASVESSRKLAEKVAAARAGHWNGTSKAYKARRPWFNLRPTGPALVAIAWKNFISAIQIPPRLIIGLAIMLIVIMVSVGQSGGANNIRAVLGMIFGMLVVWSFLLGPQILRQDLRQDLPLADLLKSYPLPGWQIVLGELLAPVLILSFLQLGLLLLAFLGGSAILRAGELRLGWGVLAGGLVGVTLLVPCLNLVMMQIPNAAALLFPAWLQSKDSPQGIEATGQRIILMLGQVLAFFVLATPATFAFLVVFFLVKWLAFLALAIPVASLAAAATLALEGALGIYWLGKCFERFDVSAETT